MSHTSRSCPRCGYQRQPEDFAPDHECPRCGIIYDKFKIVPLAQQEVRETAAKKARQLESEGLPSWIKISLPVLVLAVALAAWGWLVRPGTEKAAQEHDLRNTLSSWPYPIQGTWKGTLREVYPARNDMPAYEADYEARVIVGDDLKVKEVRWTDNHTPVSRISVSWNEGVSSAVGEERSGGTPEKMLESMNEYLHMQRKGDTMKVSYNRPLEMELEMTIPDGYPRIADKAPDGSQLQPDSDSVTAVIPVRLLADSSWTLPSNRISEFAMRSKVLSTHFSGQNNNTSRLISQTGSDYIDDCKFSRFEVFSGGSGGMYFEFNLDHVSVARKAFFKESMDSIGTEGIRLDSKSIMTLRSNSFERQVRIRFEKDGQKTLEVKDRRLQPSGQALVFKLERIE